MSDVTLAITGYQAYGDAVSWKNHYGGDMPQWVDLPLEIRAAWLAAALAVKGAS